MRQLMLSLDKSILDPNSFAAKRMVQYGLNDELFIVVPCSTKRPVDLSATVHVLPTGGKGKVGQFLGMYKISIGILRQQKPELITTQDPFFTGLIGLMLKRRFHTTCEVQIHADVFGSRYYRTSGLGNGIRYCIGRFVISGADRIRVVGERIRQSLVSMGLTAERIRVQPIAINTEYIKAYEPKINLHNKYPGFKKIFLCLGRLDPIKNIPWLIRLFVAIVKEHSDYLLLIVGNGVELSKLQQVIAGLNMQKNVRLESWTHDPLSYIKTADAVLFPSLSEGYGLVAMEAAAAHVPLIMSDVGVAGFELQPSSHVIIIPLNDAKRWFKEIVNL